jgi:DNA uptake protein ComE-like DNA-binding protein
MYKEWFFFPRGDRRAILLLSVLLTIMMSVLWWESNYDGQSELFVSIEDSLAFTSLEKGIGRFEEGGSYVSRPDSILSVNHDIKEVSAKIRKSREESFSSKPRVKNKAWVEKFQTDTVIDLNVADTLLLKRVPGIGSWRARRIVEFRGHLGGYSRVGQLLEIDGMPDSVLHWFAIHTPPRKVLNLNNATADEMAAHPYLTYKQARVVLRHNVCMALFNRLTNFLSTKNFPKSNWKGLSLMSLFDSANILYSLLKQAYDLVSASDSCCF